MTAGYPETGPLGDRGPGPGDTGPLPPLGDRPAQPPQAPPPAAPTSGWPAYPPTSGFPAVPPAKPRRPALRGVRDWKPISDSRH